MSYEGLDDFMDAMSSRERYTQANSLARSIITAHHFKRDEYYNEFYEPDEYESQLYKLHSLLGFDTHQYSAQDDCYHWLNQERYSRWSQVKDRYCFFWEIRALEKPMETIDRWIGLCKRT